jgi:hypothetical protein
MPTRNKCVIENTVKLLYNIEPIVYNMEVCQYKDLFGKIGTGIHSYRVFNIAYLDVLVTVIGAYFLSVALDTPFLYTLIAFFILGIIIHRLLCVRTTIDKLLFP